MQSVRCQRGRPWRWLVVAFLALLLIQFVFRGPLRAIRGGLDLAAPYAGTKAWVRGDNPYDLELLREILRTSGREADAVPPLTPSVYPPPTFLALAPLATLQWPAARAIMLAVNLALIGLAVRALTRMLRVQGRFERATVALCALSIAPFATGLALGQLAVASVALVIIALERSQAGDHRGAAAALTVALLLKPQVAGLFVVYLLLRGPRPVPVAGISTYAMVALASLVWMDMHGVPWFSSLTANGAAELRGGAIDPRGPLSAQMVDPRPLIAALWRVEAPLWSGVVLVGGAGAVLVRLGRRMSREHDPLLAANVAVLSLLAGYHRFYDAAVLCLPLAWALAVAMRGGSLRRYATASLVCMIPFFASGGWALQRLTHEGAFPPSIAQSVWWDAVVLRHQTWALLALAGVLLLAARRAARDEEAIREAPSREVERSDGRS